MHRTARTAPGTGSAPILAAVVLVLLAALGIAGPPPDTTGEPVVGTVAAAVRDGAHEPRVGDVCGTVWAGGPRADDACDTVCAVRAAPRQEPYGEVPAPRGHLATRAPGTDVTPADSAARLPAPALHTPSSDPHAPRDRGRAPPAASGI